MEDGPPKDVEDQGDFLDSVDRGIAAAERDDFVEEAEMDARVKKMLND